MAEEAAAAAAAAAAATAAAVEFTRSVFACGPDRHGSGRFFMTGCCGELSRYVDYFFIVPLL